MSFRSGSLLLAFIVLLPACEGRDSQIGTLDLTDILGGEAAEGFEQAVDIRQFHFPGDHGSHPGFRNEWWYFTGNLNTEDDRHFGYQITFFRTSLKPGRTSDPKSKWMIQDIWMAHVAVTDIQTEKHYSKQRFSRGGPSLAGVSLDPVKMWLDDWQGVGRGNDFPWQVSVRTDEFSLQLSLTAAKPPVLQGDQGLSRKSTAPGNASYYYSYSRLHTKGKVRIGNRDHAVTGSSWFDREWSTSSLDAGQTGWDWFSLQFESGEDLMYYQLRDKKGFADGNSQGSWIDGMGIKTRIEENHMQLEVLKEWQTAAGQQYPTRWQMDYLDQRWIIQAAVEDQFMDLAVPYWEGAVEIYDPESLDLVGRGYLEMTRINARSRR